MPKLKEALLSAALAMTLIWPALYNRQPLMFADTTAYIRGAAVGFARFLHIETIWSPNNLNVQDTGVVADGRPIISNRSVLAGRSVYYGALLYLSQLSGGKFWLAVILQGLAVTASILLTLKAFGLFTPGILAVFCITLTAFTSLPFFVSYLMPDIFSSIAILAVANLIVAGHRMSRVVFVSWWCLLTSATLFHMSNVLISLMLLCGVMVYFLIARRSIPWNALCASTAALLVAVFSEAAFSAVTKKAIGVAPLRPPFLTARLIADGPGRRYLSRSCPGSGFELCKYLPRIAALTTAKVSRPISDEFLWNVDPAIGVFSAVDTQMQRQLATEQLRFLWATLSFDPAGVLWSETGNALRQIGLFGLKDFDLDAGGRSFLSAHLPGPYLKSLENSRMWTNSMPTKLFSSINDAVVLGSLFIIFSCYVLWTPLSLSATGIRTLSVIIAAGVLANAIACGCLSGPHDRYQSRVIWLLPFIALLLFTTLLKILRVRAGFAVVPRRIANANAHESLTV